MDFDLTETEEAFRKEVEAFIKANITPEIKNDVSISARIDTPARQAFITKMAKKGWLGKGFPKEYGGDGQDDPMAKFVLNTELFKAGAPIIGKNLGQVCAALMLHGSEELKREFISRTIRNEIQWTIAYSEPGAGSDLGSMRCKAEIDGDDFIINGEKRWISSAHYADYFWLAVRTDPNVPKHKGISLMIVETNAPGVTIQPITMAYDETKGERERTNTIFFDNVRVPRSRLVGELNRGWYYMMNALGFERFLMISAIPVVRKYQDLLDWLCEAKTADGKPLRDDPVVRHKIAKFDTKMEMARLLDLRCICMAAAGRVPSTEAMMNKAYGSMMHMELADLALEIMGGPDGYRMDGPGKQMADNYLFAAHTCIAAAGVDVAKGSIAKHYLKLPS